MSVCAGARLYVAVARPVAVFGQLVDEAQCRLTAEAWFEFAMRGVAENQAAQTVTAVMSRPRQERSSTARVDRLEAAARRKMHVRPQVDAYQNGSFPLLAKQFGIGRGTARRHPPVDAARIIARLIRPRLVELHAAAAKVRNIRTCLQGIDPQHIERNSARRAVEANQAGLADADR